MLGYLIELIKPPFLRYKYKKTWPYYQSQGNNVTECGPTITAVFINLHHNTDVTRDQIRRSCPSPVFYTLELVGEILKVNNVPSKYAHLEGDIDTQIAQIQDILYNNRLAAFHVDGFHFVQAMSEGAKVRVIDPIKGIFDIPFDSFARKISHPTVVYI